MIFHLKVNFGSNDHPQNFTGGSDPKGNMYSTYSLTFDFGKCSYLYFYLKLSILHVFC